MCPGLGGAGGAAPGHRACLLPTVDRRWAGANRGSKGGRPPVFDRDAYKERSTVERCVNKLRQHRAVATRYDKRERIHQGTIDVASIRIWLRHPVM